VKGLLLAFFLAQVATQNPGVVTGIVRDANGIPASGVRVYAMAVGDTTQAPAAPPALESIAQTDAAGHYRLEVPAGRYYIASGAVGSPTYYPATTDVASARVISIVAGGIVQSIDFSSFVPASRTLIGGNAVAQLPPGSTGVLEGTIRFQDGTPASGLAVAAIPAAALGPGVLPALTLRVSTSLSTGAGGVQMLTVRRVVNGYNIAESRTDANGRYRLGNLPPETYYIVSGYAAEPQFFPGTTEIRAARTVTTTPTTQLNGLDFELSLRGSCTRSAAGLPLSRELRPAALPCGSRFLRPHPKAFLFSDCRAEISIRPRPSDLTGHSKPSRCCLALTRFA
jgi:hypothetical protein